MKIAILGTRGIPNNYGGFEQFAEYLSVGLLKRGHEVSVYTPHNHTYQESSYKGVSLIQIYDPEHYIGTFGQFIYDFLSILDSRKQNFDLILQLGYTSSSLFYNLHPKNVPIVTNMDGMEWKRSKYSSYVQRFLRFAESLAVQKSDYLVSDSVGIQSYLSSTYNIASTYIPYGANIFKTPNKRILDQYSLQPYRYNMLIARLEPENSIEIILEGVLKCNSVIPFLVIGRHDTKYGEYLKIRFSHPSIHFLGPIYTLDILNNLRYFSNIYFHGHTVGGTNPSLLEAMGSGALVCAHDNLFNRAILSDDGFYFFNSEDVSRALSILCKKSNSCLIANNYQKISTIYSWDSIIQSYEKLFFDILKVKNGRAR